MSVENLKIIDVVSIDKSENVVLGISDHLEWDENNEHLLLLQEKINLYLAAIENGSLYEQYPNAKNRNIEISITAKFSPSSDGKLFLKRVKETLSSAGYAFSFSVLHLPPLSPTTGNQ